MQGLPQLKICRTWLSFRVRHRVSWEWVRIPWTGGLVLLIELLTCSANLKRESITSPKSFVVSTCSMCLQLIEVGFSGTTSSCSVNVIILDLMCLSACDVCCTYPMHYPLVVEGYSLLFWFTALDLLLTILFNVWFMYDTVGGSFVLILDGVLWWFRRFDEKVLKML